MKINRQA